MDWKRVLRIAVCLVLVCTLVIGISPLRADAFVVEATTVSAVGLTLYLYLLWSGFVVPPPDIGIYQDLDDSFRHYLDDLGIDESSWASDADDLDDEWESSDSSDGDGSDSSGSVTINVGQTLRNLMRAFVCGGLVKASIDLFPDIEAPSTGWTYYGDYYLPTFPSPEEKYPEYDFPYMTLFVSTTDVTMIWSELPLYRKADSVAYTVNQKSVYRKMTGSLSDIADWNINSQYTGYMPTSKTAGSNVFSGCDVSWSNYNIYLYSDGVTLHHAGSDPISSENKYLVPSAIIGSIAGGIQNGTLAEEDVNLPPILDISSVIKSGMANYHEDMVQVAQDLIDGKISHEDFQEQLAYNDNTGEDIPGVNDPIVNPDDPGGDGETIPADSTFADFPVLNFFAKLGELLQNISDGNLLGIKNLLDPWLQDIRGDLSGVRDDLFGIDSSIQDGFQDVIDANEQQSQLNQEVQQEQNNIISQGFASVAGMVSSGISAAFVPSEGFFDQKVDDLCNEYSFAASIADTAKDMKSFLTNIGSVPPVIRINLGAATGKYHYGGDMVLVDFSFYEPYKPQMDAILSAFLWLWFCWRVILSLPGIISGASGVIGAFAPSDVGSRGYIDMPHASSGQSDSPRSYIRGWGSPGSTSHYNAWRDKMARED